MFRLRQKAQTRAGSSCYRLAQPASPFFGASDATVSIAATQSDFTPRKTSGASSMAAVWLMPTGLGKHSENRPSCHSSPKKRGLLMRRGRAVQGDAVGPEHERQVAKLSTLEKHSISHLYPRPKDSFAPRARKAPFHWNADMIIPKLPFKRKTIVIMSRWIVSC